MAGVWGTGGLSITEGEHSQNELNAKMERVRDGSRGGGGGGGSTVSSGWAERRAADNCCGSRGSNRLLERKVTNQQNNRNESQRRMCRCGAPSAEALLGSTHRRLTLLLWSRPFNTKLFSEMFPQSSAGDALHLKDWELFLLNLLINSELCGDETLRPDTSQSLQLRLPSRNRKDVIALKFTAKSYSVRRERSDSIRAPWAVCQPKYLHCLLASSGGRERDVFL